MTWIGLLPYLLWLLRVVMLFVILRRRLPVPNALAWLVLIFFEPVIGTGLYLLVGYPYLGRKRVRLHLETLIRMRSQQALGETPAPVTMPQIPEPARQIVVQAERYGDMPILGRNGVELLAETDETLERIVADIDAATHHVHLVVYIFANDTTAKRVADALSRAAERGVECRVLADHVGSRPFFRRRGLARAMREAGVDVRPALPVAPLRRALARLDLRNHRKIIVIDGKVGYTGSQNIVDDSYGQVRAGPWHDMMGRFRGPVVSELQAVFLEDWAFETGLMLDQDVYLPQQETAGEVVGQVVATGPRMRHELMAIPRVMLAAINSAQRRIIMTTPYLILDEAVMMALSMAADRGVEVDVVVPRKSDHPLVHAAGCYYYDRLLDSGVTVHLHQRGLLHAKTVTVDDSFALLGSVNLDVRSFYLNFECSVLMYGHVIAQQLRFAQMRYLNEAKKLDAKAWHARPALQRYGQAAAALFSPLL